MSDTKPAAVDSLAVAEEVDSLCDRFEAALRRGEAATLDGWLPPAGPLRRPALVELVRIDLEHRRRTGEAATLADYISRFPELQADAAVLAPLKAAAPAVDPAATCATNAEATNDATTTTVADLAAPIVLPGYAILGELGRGGMGAVLKGHDRELERDLAIKILLESLRDHPDAIRRFLEEVRVSSRLQHPGVVPVYAAGRLPDRRPFFTMKLVEGRTLSDLLKERDTPARDLPRFLKVFEQICQTLAYAHSKGVLHRDLKPANVMVGAFGEVQVMDWGLAKMLGRGGDGPSERSQLPSADATATLPLADDARHSEAGSVVGTPAYMAPEQARGEAVDEGSDVFGLGAMLCEILTGAPPFRGQGLAAVLFQAARAELSDSFGRLDGCGADAELVRLAKMCLAAAPEDRPRDAGEAAKSVTTYLAGVQERLRQSELAKAAAQARAVEERKRRRLTVVLAATVLLAVGGVGAGALWFQRDQSVRAAEHARRAADTDRDVTAALDEAAALGRQAEAVKADPTKWEAALKEALSAVKRAEGLLNGGVDETARLKGRVALQRETLEAADRDRRLVAALEEARFQGAAAGIEGGFDKAGAAALYATAFRQDDREWESLGPDEAAARISRRAIREEALAALDEWAGFARNKDEKERVSRIVQEADPDPASFRNRCRALMAKKDWDGLRLLASGLDATDVPAASLVSVGRQLYGLGAPSEAVKFLKAALERRPGDFWIAFELGYASFKTTHPRTDEAIRYFTAALMLRPDSAVTHSNLGLAFLDRGRLDEAIAECRKAIELKPVLAEAHTNLGAALYDRRRLDEAVAEFRAAVELKPDYAEAHTNLGDALYDQGQVHEAVAEYHKAIELKPDDIKPHYNLGNVFHAKGQWDEAAAEYRRAIEIMPDYAPAHNNLAAVLYRKHQLDEALTEYNKAIELKPDYAEAHFNLANTLYDKGRLDEAVVEFRKAAELKPDYVKAHYNLGIALCDKGQLDEAITAYRKCLQIQPDYAEAWCNLGQIFKGRQQFGESLAAYRRGHRFGSQNPKWSYPSAQWVREAEDRAERDGLLPAILQSEAAPADADQQARFADFCQRYKGLNATASRFYADAFAAEPALANDLASGARYDAACVAALAGCGKGEDAAAIDDKQRARCRQEARDWLRADLGLWSRKLSDGKPDEIAAAAKIIHHWKEDADLAGVRGADALAKLPLEEQDAWRQLWDDVDALLKKAREK